MTPQELRDTASDEREFAAECIAHENWLRLDALHDYAADEGELAARALSRAAELERAAALDEVA